MKHTENCEIITKALGAILKLGSIIACIVLFGSSPGLGIIIGIVGIVSAFIYESFTLTICEISKNLYFIRKSVSDDNTDENDDTDDNTDSNDMPEYGEGVQL